MPVVEIVDWLPLADAPRDGTEVLVAVSARGAYPGYVTIGRWLTAESEEGLSKSQRYYLRKHGGWWGRGKHSKPFGRPLRAWMPMPFFDFEEEAMAHG